MWRTVGGLGEWVLTEWHELRYTAAVIGTVLLFSVRPRSWAHTVRQAFAREIMAIGVRSTAFACGMAILVGITVVVQIVSWIRMVGESQVTGTVLMALVAR